MSSYPRISIVIATYDRRDVTLNTLARLRELELVRSQGEIILVDNASTDGTAAAVREQPGVRLVALDENLGSCAKAVGVEQAQGEFVLFLDDDSYPRPGCLERMLAHFEREPTLGAAGFTVHLPNGNQECSALPHVFVGCGVGLRTSAVREVDGLDRTFFMQAEEYDLSFRLLQAGWRVEVRGDLQVEHLKSPKARRSERTTFHDVRNNLRIIARYLPQYAARVYTYDWLLRYRWLAQREGHHDAFARGLAAGREIAWREHWENWRWRLSRGVFEQVFCWQRIEGHMRRLAGAGVRRIVLADVGKNTYAYWRGARAAGLEVAAIASDDLADGKRAYRGVKLTTVEAAIGLSADAWIISNTSYVHAARRAAALEGCVPCPVYNWFFPPSAEEEDRAGQLSGALVAAGVACNL